MISIIYRAVKMTKAYHPLCLYIWLMLTMHTHFLIRQASSMLPALHMPSNTVVISSTEHRLRALPFRGSLSLNCRYNPNWLILINVRSEKRFDNVSKLCKQIYLCLCICFKWPKNNTWTDVCTNSYIMYYAYRIGHLSLSNCSPPLKVEKATNILYVKCVPFRLIEN